MSVEDAEAEERATDEGMPEPPGGTTSSVAAPTGLERAPGPPEDEEFEEDDGGYDLGGEA